jgi:D-tyrosyl-tRNA(Tyr) deacylase
LILLGVKRTDTEADAFSLAERCVRLRIFDDAAGKMNRSVQDVHGSALVVSQFTLYGETRKGNRPDYSDAAPSAAAEKLYEHFVEHLRRQMGDDRVATGVFRAMMDVELVNDGPVTVLLENNNHH